MSMATDPKKILEKVRGAIKKKAFTYSLDPGLMEDFKRLCDEDEVKQAPIIEEIIREYVEAHKKKK